MPKRTIRISEYMTKAPYRIGAEQSLSRAHDIMRKRRVRHLPVLHGGKLVGLVSLRDLHIIETLQGVEPDEVRVEEAMSQDVYTVEPEAPLRDVASEMARRKLGSAIVVDKGKIVGVFTTVDALKALGSVLV